VPSLPVLTYNSIPLLMSKLLRFDATNVVDDSGCVHLYTHYDIVCRCVVHPNVTQPFPPPSPPLMSGAALAELQNRLLQPRKLLQIRIGNDTVLEAPQLTSLGVRMACDAANGPMPRRAVVSQNTGDKTIEVDYHIECWVNQCRNKGGALGDPPPTLLSNRWEMSEDIDKDYISTRTIRGRAIFRADFLLRRGVVPDDVRNYIIAPVMPGFARDHLVVAATSDGTGCVYTVVDRQRPWGLGRAHAGVRVIKGTFSKEYDWYSLVNPQLTRTWTVHAFGFPKTRSQTLVSSLEAVFATTLTASGSTVLRRMGAVGAAGFARLPFNALEVHLEYASDGAPHAWCRFPQYLGKTPAGAGAVLVAAAFSEDWPEDAGVLGGPTERTSPSMQRDSDRRSSELVRVVAQALHGPCDTPPAATNPTAPRPTGP
jgi:hypothetical protein